MQNNRSNQQEKKRNREIWRVSSGNDIAIRYWDGDFVVFNSLSGETHLLDIVSGKVLSRIMEGPASPFEIQSEIADFLDVENQQDLTNAIEEILNRLEDAGLVEIHT